MTDQQDARHLLERAERAATAGDLAAADELLRDAARIQEQELGPHHPDLANTLNNLAIVAEKTGRSSEAETFYRRAATIAAAAFPSDHPMAVESRQNLVDFCRANGLPIGALVVTTPTWDDDVNAFPSERGETDQIPIRPATIALEPTLKRSSRSLQWLAIGALVLAAVVIGVWRPWLSRDASSTSPPQPVSAQPAAAAPPQAAAPSNTPAAIEQKVPAEREPPPADRKTSAKKAPAAGGITVATAQLCRNFSTSGSNWRCDPVGNTAAPGRLVFYTRVRSPRNTAVVHRWYRGSTLRQSVTLTIQANATEGYRTYSRQTVNEGDWRLELRSADGNLLYEQRFAVQ